MRTGRSRPHATPLQNFDCRLLIADFWVCDAFVLKNWIKRYLKFYGMSRHPSEMGAAEVERYLSHLATEGKVSVSTQRQALNAIVFMYRDVLNVDLGRIAPIRGKRHRKPPTVLTQDEVRGVLRNMKGTHRLMGQLLYGCGLRLTECIRLRIQDVDLNRASPYFLRKLSALRFGGRGVCLSGAARAARIVWCHCRKRSGRRWRTRSKGLGICTKRICGRVSGRSIFPRHWRGNIQTRAGSSAGSMFFRRRDGRWIQGPEKRCGTM